MAELLRLNLLSTDDEPGPTCMSDEAHMVDEVKSGSWWHTVPGIITSVTATITAVAGLLVALKQVGWIGDAPATAAQSQQGSGPGSARSTSATGRAVELPAQREYTFRDQTYTLLGASLSPQTTEKDALRIRVRLLNNYSYNSILGHDDFRLIVDGVPRAPENHLADLVAPRSAKEGELLFVVPKGTATVNLVISHQREQTAIPLSLVGNR